MRLKILSVALTMVLSLGFSLASIAGTIADGDSDLIPDVLDNCVFAKNGPLESGNQVDTDDDSCGNICDCDFDQNNNINGLDIVALFGVFLTSSPLHDLDSNGEVNGLDVVLCFQAFLLPPC